MAGAGSPGAGSRWRVFVSHTSELRNFPAGAKSYIAEAERAISAAGHVVVDMADFPATDQPAADLCADRVRGCDVYVGVLGTRYGSPVRDKSEVSYTELEFDAATAAGLPRLVFVLDTDAADVGIPLAQLIDHAFGARQEAFRRRVQASGLVTQSFASPDQLGRVVERSLRELAAAHRDAGPLPPDSVLRVWNVPARNPGFTGRDELLAAVRERLLAGDTAVVQALQGMGGVGKTQLAIEYAHRFAELRPGLVGQCRAGRADRRPVRRPGAALGCVQPGAGTEAVRAAVLAELRQRGRWLLVFDNAEDPADLRLAAGRERARADHLPERGWAESPRRSRSTCWPGPNRSRSLQRRVPRLVRGRCGPARRPARRPAAGDRPGGRLHGRHRHTAGQYLDLLQTRAGQLLDQGAPGLLPAVAGGRHPADRDRLDDQDPAAAELASLCAFLAPEPIPEDLFTGAAGDCPASSPPGLPTRWPGGRPWPS